MKKPEYAGDEKGPHRTYHLLLDPWLDNLTDLAVITTVISDPPTQAQVVEIKDKLNTLLKRLGTDES